MERAADLVEGDIVLEFKSGDFIDRMDRLRCKSFDRVTVFDTSKVGVASLELTQPTTYVDQNIKKDLLFNRFARISSECPRLERTFRF